MGAGAAYSIKYKIDFKDMDFNCIKTTEDGLITEDGPLTTIEFFPETAPGATASPIAVEDFEIESYEQYQKISTSEGVGLRKITIAFPTNFLECVDDMIDEEGYGGFMRTYINGTFETLIGSGYVRTLMPNQFPTYNSYSVTDPLVDEVFEMNATIELEIDDRFKNFIDNVVDNGNVAYEYCVDEDLVRYFNTKEEVIEAYGTDGLNEAVKFTSDNGETIYRLEVEVPNSFDDEDECIEFCKKNGLGSYTVLGTQYDYDGNAIDLFSDTVNVRG